MKETHNEHRDLGPGMLEDRMRRMRGLSGGGRTGICHWGSSAVRRVQLWLCFSGQWHDEAVNLFYVRQAQFIGHVCGCCGIQLAGGGVQSWDKQVSSWREVNDMNKYQ